MADFTGFYFDGIHSSTFGILRVSDGDRYTEGLVPDFQDYEIEIPSGGSIYQGRRFKKVEFKVNIAFDNMTEKQLRDLRKWLSTDDLKQFRFDERPYKTYWAKLASRPELEYICFLEDEPGFLENDKIRIYKGEGSLNFVCYDPIGYCIDETYHFEDGNYIQNEKGFNWQDLNNYERIEIKDQNSHEWAYASGIRSMSKRYHNFKVQDNVQDGYGDVFSAYRVDLYNPGDLATDFQLLIDFGKRTNPSVFESPIIIELLAEDGSREGMPSLMISSVDIKNFDKIFIDSKKHLIILYHNQEQFNKYNSEVRYDLLMDKDDRGTNTSWFSIPQGKSILQVRYKGTPLNCTETNPEGIYIKYNYKYY